MPRTAILASVLVLFGAALAVESPDSSPGRIAKLVKQLGSAKFTERESATKVLDAIGEPAVAELQAAGNSGDPETRGRAKDLLKRIGHRALVARILKPTMVALNFDNTPVIDAMAVLAKQTGLTIDRQPNGFPGNRRVSVKSDPLPAWEAVELFCRKADLHEWNPSIAPPNGMPQTTQVVGAGNIVFGGAQPVVVNGRVMRSGVTQIDKVIMLDGPGAALPTCHSGAVRLRLLPAGAHFPVEYAEGTLLPIHVTAEPHVQFSGITSVLVQKAIDDQGGPVSASSIIAPVANNEQVMILQMANGALMPQFNGLAGLAALRIPRTNNKAKSLSLISGELSAKAYVAEPLAQIESPFKPGTTTHGASDVRLSVVQMAAPVPGELELTVEMSTPPEVQVSGMARNAVRVAAQGGIVFQQQIVANAGGEPPRLPGDKTDFFGLSIEDAHGKRWTATHGQQESMQFGLDGLTSRLIVRYKAPNTDSDAARLVFRGSRPVVITVPFTFRDVPLP